MRKDYIFTLIAMTVIAICSDWRTVLGMVTGLAAVAAIAVSTATVFLNKKRNGNT